MAYNLTNISSAKTPIDLVLGIDSAVGGYIGIGLLTTIFFAVLIFAGLHRNRNFVPSMISASFVSSIAGILLLSLGLIGMSIAQIPIALFIIFLIIQSFSGD